MEYLLWAGIGAGLALVVFFLLTRRKARDVEGVMHQFGSQADRPAWRKPSASVWEESQADARPREDDEPPARS